MKLPTFVFALLLALAVAGPGYLSGQTAQSEVTGEVTDTSGAPIVGVRITLTNAATGVRTTMQTNEAGHYYQRALPPGSYTLQAEHPGFKTYSATGIDLQTGQILRLDLPLVVGDVTTTVEVSALAANVEIQKDSGDVSTVINKQTVDEIPKVTRRTLELMAISPAVTMTEKGGWHTVYVPFFSTAGNPGQRASMFYVDGTSTTFARAQGDGGGMSNFNPPPEVVQEVRVVYNNYSAEFGEGMGAVIVSTTKSGTNRFNGSAYYFIQNDAFDARNFFASKVNPNKFHNFGGVFGGPIVKDRTHFFVGLDRQRWIQQTPFVLTLPSTLQRQGDFSQTFDSAGNLIPIYDPAATVPNPAGGNPTRTAFPGNIIPRSRLNPIMLNVLNNYHPDPNSPATITGANNFRADGRTRDLTGLTQFYRLDHQFSANDRAYFRFSRDDVDPPFYGPYAGTKGAVADPWEESYTSFGQTIGGKYTRVISSSTFSDFSFGYTNFAVDRRALGNNKDVRDQNWAAKLGLKNVAPDTFPNFNFAGYAQAGGGTWVQQLTYNTMRSWSFYETLSHIRGKHNLRFGGGWKHSKAVYASRFWPSGRLSFDTRATAQPGVAGTGNSIASALLGEVASGDIQESPAPDMRTWFATLFLQDDWRISRTLTLNLGVRYEYDRPKVDVTEGASFFDFTKLNPVCNCPGVIEFGINKWRDQRTHTPLYYQPPLQFAPRIGVAWTPIAGKEVVIRGGYGLFYTGGDYGDVFWNGPLLGRGIIQNWSSDGLGVIPAFRLSEAFPQVPQEPLNDAWGAVPIGSRPRVDAKFFWYDRKAGYLQQLNFGVQYKLGAHLIETAYIGALGRKLPAAGGMNVYNEVRPELRGPGDAQLVRPFPQFGQVIGYGENRFTSNYHAGFVSVRKSFTKGFTYQANYTLARHLDNLSPRSTYDLEQDYGPSGLQRHHRFVFSGVYELPFGKGKPLLSSGLAGKIVGGWNLSAFYEIRSGAPFSVGSIVNNCNCFSQGGQGADIAAGANWKRTGGDFDPGRDTWFNTSVFGFGQNYRFGTAGKGIIESPNYSSLDASIARRVTVTERYAFELRGEFFNSLNRVSFNGPATAVGSPAFGRVTSAGDPRRVQLGAKLYF